MPPPRWMRQAWGMSEDNAQNAPQNPQNAQIDMSKMSKAERKALKRKLREERENQQARRMSRDKLKKRATTVSLVILIIAALGALFFVMGSASGKYDGFARCLKEKGAVIYGDDFCEFTKRQMGMFGSSFGYLNYVKCAENSALCESKGVSVTPTWEVGGSMYSGVQTFEKLSEVSGCTF